MILNVKIYVAQKLEMQSLGANMSRPSKESLHTNSS